MLCERGAAGGLPRAPPATARWRAALGLGCGACAPGAHRALLRPLHSRHRDLGLRDPRGHPGPAGARARLPRGLPALSGSAERGALAIVLHTHMPYVEGFGTWPFG